METRKSEIKQIVKTKSLLDSLLKKRTANKVKTSMKIKLVISLLKMVIKPRVKRRASTTKKIKFGHKDLSNKSIQGSFYQILD